MTSTWGDHVHVAVAVAVAVTDDGYGCGHGYVDHVADDANVNAPHREHVDVVVVFDFVGDVDGIVLR